MPKFTGRLYEVGIGRESTTRGVGVAATFWIPKTVVTFDDKVTKALVAGSYGHISDAAMTAQVVGKWAEGNIEGEINANSFGLILYALCGVTSPAGPTDGTYTHSYTIENDVTPDSLTIHTKYPTGTSGVIAYKRYRLATLNSLSIDVTLGEMVTYVANFVSKVHQDVTSSVASYAIDHRFTSADLTFRVAPQISDFDKAYGDAGYPVKLCVKHLTLEFARNVERIDCLGSLEPEDIVTKGFRITGTLELDYEDDTWRNYMLNHTVLAMQIDLLGSKLIGTTTYPEWNMIFPKVHFEAWEPALGLDDIASQTLNFDVFYDLSNTRLWSTFDLVNSCASY